ncbi:MAG TPA: hypothetical protein VGH86_09720 [Phenylobacterium sp.]|jgi:hypothetical protein
MRTAALLFALLLAGGPAQSQESFVRPDCQPPIAPDPLSPDPLTARWYRRFWTGECNDLRGCRRGSPNWNEIVGQLLARSPPGARAEVLARACKLGPLIGHEWTRPSAVRRIDTGDLGRFNSTLKSAPDVLEGLARVEAQARAKIAGQR